MVAVDFEEAEDDEADDGACDERHCENSSAADDGTEVDTADRDGDADDDDKVAGLAAAAAAAAAAVDTVADTGDEKSTSIPNANGAASESTS